MAIVETFTSRAEMDRRAQALRALGALVLPDDQVDTGVLGYTVIPTLRVPDTRLVFYVHGKLLKPEVKVVDSAAEFVTWLRSHDAHVRSRSNLPKAKQIGMVCFCKASEGRSQVIRMSVDKTRHLAPAVLGEIMKATSG